MIIVKLKGGLGNQMFQYAMGRMLAIKNNTSLKLDISEFENKQILSHVTLRSYDLSHFNIVEEIATKEEIYAIAKISNNIISKIINKVKPTKYKCFVAEKKYGYDSRYLDISRNTYIDGYWQSTKYIDSIRDILRNEFTLREPLCGLYKDIANKITSTNSVSLHIRRGDYVSNKVNSQIYNVCDPGYYSSAMEYINKKVSNPQYFVFSDDPEWVKENIKTRDMFIVDENSINYIDLYLMSLCKHNIIANSSFSWWGGWLNSFKEKIVIAPEVWFKKPSYNIKDLMPSSWIKL
ncbi:MAG: alpha-1,2-fucosyltransferase [Ignavibacteriales bacterium]